MCVLASITHASAVLIKNATMTMTTGGTTMRTKLRGEMIVINCRGGRPVINEPIDEPFEKRRLGSWALHDTTVETDSDAVLCLTALSAASTVTIGFRSNDGTRRYIGAAYPVAGPAKGSMGPFSFKGVGALLLIEQ